MDVVETLKNSLDGMRAAPLYIQLTDKFKDMIRAGELAVGDMLPSEPLLCEKLSISRSTVRQAFALLESEGFVVRRRGKGTFVSKPKLRRRLSRLCSFTQQMAELGLDSGSKVLEMAVAEADEVPEQLGSSGSAYRIVRVRETDGAPFMIDTAYVPVAFAPQMRAEALEHSSLYDIVEAQTGKTPHTAVETYEVVKLTDKEMKLLHTQTKAAFRVTRISRTVSGEPFEVATMLIRGDRCRLEAQLETGAVAFSRTLQ